MLPLHAQFAGVWELGTDNQSPAEFAEEWAVDDDFTIGEPLTGLERAISRDDPFTNVRFNLTAPQRSATARLRFRVDLTGPGWSVPNGAWLGNGWHDVRLSLNGTVLKDEARIAVENNTIVVEVDTAAVTTLSTNNVLRIERTGGSNITPDGAVSWSWIQFDYLSMEADPAALTDTDGDGLPAWWERAALRSTTAANASADPDRDGLTDLQEFTAGTNPDLADTDGDGLSDAAETTAAPLSNPLLADSDGDGLTDGQEKSGVPQTNPALADSDSDGASDAWERQTRTNPNLAGSVPPVFGQAVGLDFIQRSHVTSSLGSGEVAGVVPQPHWNATFPASQWAPTIGTMNLISNPVAGGLRNSAGAPSGITATWSSPEAGSNASKGSPDADLLEGFLAPSASVPVTVSLANIPFAKYDLIAYLGASSNQNRGTIEITGLPDTRLFYLSEAASPFQGWTEATTTKDEMDAAVAGTTIPEEISRRRQAACRSGNYVRFRGLTGAAVSLEVRRDLYGAGLCALQIVDTAADRDADGMADSFEFANGLLAATNDAAADADGDGLTNLQEFTRRTSARLTDTDGDGLSDSAESAANALTRDSDGDGLSDFAEATAPRPSNPNAADSDSDGLSDLAESEGFSDPMTTGGALRPVPVYSNPGQPTWTWEVNAQLVIDRTTTSFTTEAYGGKDIISFDVYTPAEPGDSALQMALRSEQGKLSWFFHTSRAGSFSQSGAPGNSAWYSDTADLSALLGFSGYGRADISDRLRFRCTAVRPAAANSWNLTFQILNLDLPAGSQTVVNRTFNTTTASATTNAGTTPWQNSLYDPIIVGRTALAVIPGASVWLGYPALETLAAFAPAKDTDEDGMSDVWEDANAFNKNLASDATADADSDGLNNRAEFLAGTLPRNADSDADGVRDGDEALAASNPLLAASRPPFYNTAPPAGEDLNGNGLPDLWEMWTRSFVLTSSGDADGDGFSNLDEARAGTSATDPNSRLTLDILTLSPTQRQLRWPNIANKQHRVFQSNTLGAASWTTTPGTPAPSTGMMALAVPLPSASAASRLFYRAELNDLDSDGDGLSNWTEALLGTASTSANSARAAAPRDTNADGIPDASTSGDYATYAERLLGGQAGGGYAGGASGVVSRPQAARLLTQATFGPTMADIDRLAAMGITPWINDQLVQPPTYLSPYIRRIYADFFGPQTDRSYNGSAQDSFLFGNNVSTPFFRAAVTGPDQLRQRTAFALSQILVASRRDAALENLPLGLADFYDIFVRHAFGNYLDVLTDVSLHPIMGRYLSHIGNQKANPALNQYPDENYAREVMQLFSIGLWELNPDGTRTLTPGGEPIPTYSNTQITQLARVFTGLWFGGQEWLQGGFSDANYAVPMDLYPEGHDFGAKTLLNGFTIPARAPTQANAVQDVRDAVKSLFDHPNTPVFVSRQLIQFLVSSNPGPAYVQRIQGVFVNNGSGVRGDLAAVVKAILLDPEARDPRWSMGDSAFGKLREPVIRTMHLARVGGLARVDSPVWWNWGEFYDAMKQEPLYSPSVFNFYRPDYRAPGLLSQLNLSGPVFQITDSYSAISVPNRMWDFVQQGISSSNGIRYPLDFAAEQSLAATPDLLLDRLNLLFCTGRLSAATRAIIIDAVDDLPATDARSRVHLAIYLCLTVPEGAVQR
jgi:uncharacterized protein (DUF1800 family)